MSFLLGPFIPNSFLYRIENCFTREQAETITSNVWTRLGMDPNDKSTWHTLRTNMPSHFDFDSSTFAPKAWAAICEICGGEDRIDPAFKYWKDSLIVNLGTPEGENKPVPPENFPEWHVDGDFFVHYLDSREQGLLVTPLFTDIEHHGGGTYICPPAIPKIAKHLYENPAGVCPRMEPRGAPNFNQQENLDWFNNCAKSCAGEPGAFVEATGKVGDVYLMHPLMLHAPSDNSLRRVRIITNPPIALKEPMNFDRDNEEEYSLVEKVTLKALGKDRLPGWKITGPREAVTPLRVKIQEQMRLEELKRLEGLKKQAEQTQTVTAAA